MIYLPWSERTRQEQGYYQSNQLPNCFTHTRTHAHSLCVYVFLGLTEQHLVENLSQTNRVDRKTELHCLSGRDFALHSLVWRQTACCSSLTESVAWSDVDGAPPFAYRINAQLLECLSYEAFLRPLVSSHFAWNVGSSARSCGRVCDDGLGKWMR